MAAKKRLYANINAKRERIARGSGEKMRTPGTKGAPKSGAFEKAAKTARKKPAAKARPAGTKSKNTAPAKKKSAPRERTSS